MAAGELCRRGTQVDTTRRRQALPLIAIVTMGLVACADRKPVPGPGKVPITTSSKQALEEYLVGRDLVEKLRTTEAHAHFVKAVQLDPEFALAHLGMANTAPGPVEFFASVQKAVALADRVSPGEANMIRVAEAGANSKPLEQRRLLEANAAAYPGDERAQTQLGNFLFNSGEWEAAIAAYKRAIAIDPKFSAPYNQFGYALRHLGRTDEAEKVFRTYTELIPDEPNPYDSYAELLLHLGRNEEAIAAYKKALDINPNFPSAYIGIGHALIFLGRTDEARKAFTKLRFIARNDGEARQAYLWLAASYLYEGDYDGTIAELEKRVEIARKSRDRLSLSSDFELLAEVLLEANRPSEAQAKLDESLAILDQVEIPEGIRETNRVDYLFDSARVAIRRGDLEAATRLADDYRTRTAARHIPQEERMSHALQGLLALAKGDPKAAIAELEKADPEDPRVRLFIARAKAAAGDREGAIAACRQAVQFTGPDLSLAFARRHALELLAQLTAAPQPTR